MHVSARPEAPAKVADNSIVRYTVGEHLGSGAFAINANAFSLS